MVRQRLQRAWQSVRQRETKMCHTNLQLAVHYTLPQTANVSHVKTHIFNRDYKTHHPPWHYTCFGTCVVCGLCCCLFCSVCVCVCVCPGNKTSVPLRKNVCVFQNAYLKPKQRTTRKTVGNRRTGMWNVVRMLDETAEIISGCIQTPS